MNMLYSVVVTLLAGGTYVLPTFRLSELARKKDRGAVHFIQKPPEEFLWNLIGQNRFRFEYKGRCRGISCSTWNRGPGMVDRNLVGHPVLSLLLRDTGRLPLTQTFEIQTIPKSIHFYPRLKKKRFIVWTLVDIVLIPTYSGAGTGCKFCSLPCRVYL